jgi:hypothetical protein
MTNRLIEKIRAYLKKIDLDELQYKYEEPSTNDDLIQYEPLPQSIIDDSNKNKEKLLQEIADRNGF